MKRKIENDLINWKKDKYRKPLILRGARQVGKTYTIMNFGKQNYKNVVYLNFEANKELEKIFKNTKDTTRILNQLRLLTQEKIEKENTLIFFDEVQECSDALNTLKYFSEFDNDYHIIAAGSLLGIYLSENTFPVGKVDFLDLYPMDFSEFLTAIELDGYVKILESFTNNPSEEKIEDLNLIHNNLIENLKLFYAIGGMPEVVKIWVEEKDLKLVKKQQSAIIDSYINDFSKHTDKFEATKILQVFSSVPSQLAKENKKFIYGVIKSGARAREYELALNWLINAKILYKVSDVEKPIVPLKGFEELSNFKIFMFEIGLLINYADIDASSFVYDKFETMYNGSLAENYILGCLTKKLKVFYYTFDRYKIDFLIQIKNKVIPIEVKSGENLESPSLKNYINKFNPEIAIKFSLNKFKKNDKIINVPIYLADYLDNLL